MTDDDLIGSFERATLTRLPHADHIKLAWLYVRRAGAAEAAEIMEAGLQRLAVAHGVPGKYHHTVTFAWVRLVAAAVRDAPDVDDFEQFAETHPHLFDSAALSSWFSPALLTSDLARHAWVEPDRQPLPELLP